MINRHSRLAGVYDNMGEGGIVGESGSTLDLVCVSGFWCSCW